MSLYRSVLKQDGGGGGETGTLIWTNPNSSVTLDAGQITLDSNLSNFSKIRVKWYFGGTSATWDETKECETIIPISQISTTGFNNSVGLGGISGNSFVRTFYQNAGDANNTLRTYASRLSTDLVPYKIYGIA